MKDSATHPAPGATWPGAPASLLGRGARAMATMLATVLAAWAVAAGLTGDHALPVRLGIYIAPLLMALAALLAIVAGLLRSWIPAGVSTLIATALCALLAPPLLRGPPDPATLAAPGSFSVLSLSARTGNRDMAGLARTLRHHRADVIALQEVHDPAALLDGLGDLYGETPTGACRMGHEMILSRFAVGPPEPASQPRRLFCTVDLPGGAALVGSVHMQKARFRTARQQRDYAALVEILDAETRPLVLAGDFNTTPLTTPYGRIAARLGDVFAEAGRGGRASFPTPARPLLGLAGPFLAIDHIFAGQAFRALDARVLSGHAPGADHFPVRAVLTRRQG